jgi:hypothetical protein
MMRRRIRLGSSGITLELQGNDRRLQANLALAASTYYSTSSKPHLTRIAVNSVRYHHNTAIMEVNSIIWNEDVGRMDARPKFLREVWTDIDAWTPLHLAVWNMHPDVVQLLLARSTGKVQTAKRNPVNHDHTPLQLAIQNCDWDVIEMLFNTAKMLGRDESETLYSMHWAGMRK